MTVLSTGEWRVAGTGRRALVQKPAKEDSAPLGHNCRSASSSSSFSFSSSSSSCER